MEVFAKPRQKPPTPAKKRRYTRRIEIAEINGTTKEGRMIIELRKRYTELVGGEPDIDQKQTIESIVSLSMHIEQANVRSVANGFNLKKHDADVYLAWTNARDRLIRQLRASMSKTKAKRRASGDFSDFISSLGSAAD